MFCSKKIFPLLLAFAVASQALETIQLNTTDGPIRCEFLHPLTGKQYSLAPDQTTVNAVISDGMAQVRLVQTFVNPIDATISPSYVFPLPDNGSVHGMTYQTKEGLYVAEIMEKAKAQSIFDSVQSAGGEAALLLQIKPNIFSQSMANVQVGDTVKVEITLTMPLKYTNGTFEFAFPTMVGDRCCNSETDPIFGTIGGWNPPADVEGPRVQFHVVLQNAFDIHNLTSPSHPIDSLGIEAALPTLQKQGLLQSASEIVKPHKCAVLLKDLDTYPNSDFVLRFSRSLAKPLLNVTSYSDTSGMRYFYMQLLPNESAEAALERDDLDVMLLLDVSGSQWGWPLTKSIEVTRTIIDRLRTTDRFCLMEFDTQQYLAFADTIRPATSDNKSLAQTFLNTNRGGGGTELYNAVQKLVAMPNPTGRQRLFVFITDGFITNEDSILAFLQEQIPVPQVIAFGAGNSLNRYFLESVSAMGGGFATEILSSEDAVTVTDRAWTTIDAPQMTDITVNFGSMQVQDTLLPVARRLFQGQVFSIYGKTTSTGSQSVSLTGKINGVTTTLQSSFDLGESNRLSWAVPKLWAREKIRLLELAEMRGENVKDSIIDVSLEHQVLSKYTAFIAYESIVDNQVSSYPNVQYQTVVADKSTVGSISYASSSGYYSDIREPQATRKTTFPWSDFQIRKSSQGVYLHWEATADVQEVRIFDLQGNLLFQGKPEAKAGSLFWASSKAPSLLVVEVRGSLGIHRKLFRVAR